MGFNLASKGLNTVTEYLTVTAVH